MTNIHLHGVLTESYPSLLRIQLRRISDATQALDAICDGFRLKIIKLANMGIHYAIIADGLDVKTMEELHIIKEPKEIHFIPMICGSGAVLLAAGAALMYFAVPLTAAGTFLGGLGVTTGMVMGFGTLVAGIGLQMLLAPKPKNERPESAVSGLSESSFIGASSANLMTQGSPLPLGYGRLRVGSAVINVTTKSFQASLKTNKAMLSESDGEVGLAQVAIKQGNKTR